jgi:hypothetical protein
MLLRIMLVIYEAPSLAEGVTTLGLGREERSGASARSDVYQPEKLSVGTKAQITFGTCRMRKQSVGHLQVTNPPHYLAQYSDFLEGKNLPDV